MTLARKLLMADTRVYDPYWSDVVICLNFQGADASTTFTDSSGTATYTRNGAPEIDTAQFKQGTSSLLVSGSGYVFAIGTYAAFTIGTSDFCIDTFIRLSAVGAARWLTSFGAGNHPRMYINASGYPVFYANSADRITGGTAISANTWYHLAVCRSGGVTKLFLDGIQQGSSYTDGNTYAASTANRPIIGADQSGTNAWNGWIGGFRLTKAARYPGNFTPPTFFPTVGP